LLSYLVVENLQVTIQEASLVSEFVTMMLANSSPGKMTQLNGTDSADAGVICVPARSASQTHARCERMAVTGLFPCRLPQRIVDAILPARSALPEMFKDVLVEPQRNQLLHTRKRGLFGRRFRHLGRGPLERSFGFRSGVVQGPWSSRLIWHDQIPSNSAVDR
jgi:hypothetical protein